MRISDKVVASLSVVVVGVGLLAAAGCKRSKPKPKPVLALEFTVDIDECRQEALEALGERLRAALIKKLVGRFGAGERTGIDAQLKVRVGRGGVIIRLGGTYKIDRDEVKQVATREGLVGTSSPRITLNDVEPPRGQVSIRLSTDWESELRTSGAQMLAKSFRVRLRRLGVKGAQVVSESDQVIVNVPKLSRAKLYEVKRVLSRSAHLAFRLVDDRSNLMEAIGGLIRDLNDPARRQKLPEAVRKVFRKAGVTPFVFAPLWEALAKVRVKVQKHERQGKHFQETYLQIPARYLHVLRSFFDAISTQHALRDYRLAGNQEAAFGPVDGAHAAKKPLMRSYVLRRGAGIITDTLADARAAKDSGGHPIIAIRLGAGDEKKFRAFTRKNLKRRLAIVLNEWVVATPVIQTEIGARVHITLGQMKSKKERAQKAKDLATVLLSGRTGCAIPILRRERPIK